MGFSRQESWSGLPFLPPGNLPNPGIEPASPALAGRFFTTGVTWKPPINIRYCWLLFPGRALVLDWADLFRFWPGFNTGLYALIRLLYVSAWINNITFYLVNLLRFYKCFIWITYIMHFPPLMIHDLESSQHFNDSYYTYKILKRSERLTHTRIFKLEIANPRIIIKTQQGFRHYS